MKLRIRLAISRERVAASLRWVCRLSLAGAGILLAWPITVLVNSQLAQWSGAQELERQIRAVQAQPSSKPPPTKLHAAGEEAEIIIPEPAGAGGSTLPPGVVLGQLEIARLKIAYIVLEGTDADTLDRSIGHIRNTALPGQTGNVGIAGHRNTHFRRLEWIRRDDEIVLTSPQGVFRYRTEWVRLFKPTDLQVLDPSHGPALTLVTCFPFEYVGDAPLRFVVRALPDEQTRSRLQHPAEVTGD